MMKLEVSDRSQNVVSLLPGSHLTSHKRSSPNLYLAADLCMRGQAPILWHWRRRLTGSMGRLPAPLRWARPDWRPSISMGSGPCLAAQTRHSISGWRGRWHWTMDVD
jgi:hypothetical protein